MWLPLNSNQLYVAGGVFSSIPLAVVSNKSVTLRAPAGESWNMGPIATSTLGAGGSGYAVNDTGVIDPSSTVSSGDATYKVLTVDGSGAVLTYSVTAAGAVYPVANAIPTGTGGAQPGAGVGLTLNVTAITPGDGTLVCTLYYAVVSL